GSAARADSGDRGRHDRQAHRLRRRRPRHEGTRKAGRCGSSRRRVLDVSREREGSDRRLGRRRNHAAEKHLVRAEAARRPLESPDMSTVHRVFNFAAGPAVMPVPVLEQIQRDLLALPGVGISILEISHRSKEFEAILEQTEADIRTLAAIPSNYRVLFLQGGASLQFSMVPMNLLGAGATADYIDTGSWADKAIKEAKKIGQVNVAASTKAENYSRLPRQEELTLTPGAAYVHMTSNNTIEGTEYRDLPAVGDVPLVSDTSSDMFSHPIDVSRHALIYAGAQKNMGPAGLTVVIVREDLLARSQKT